jgi:hypothetical protein
MTIFGLFWLACLLSLGMASVWAGQLLSEPPASSQSLVLTVTILIACLLAAAVLPWVGIASAIWARRAGAGVDSLVALVLNALAALLVVLVLGASLATWASS